MDRDDMKLHRRLERIERMSRDPYDVPSSTRPEGRKAKLDGLPITANPYIRGEDRWAWDQGWNDSK